MPSSPLPSVDHKALVAHVAQIVGMDDAEDVVQTAYVKILSTRAPFRGQSSAKTWVYSVARNCAYSHLRKRRRTDAAEHVQSNLESLETPDTCAAILDMDVRRAIAKLKPEYRLVVLSRLQYDSVKATARALGLTPGAVKMRHQRAIHVLRQLLSEETLS